MRNKSSMMSLLAATMLMGGYGAGINSPSDSVVNDRNRYKGKGFSGGQSIMRKFVINGHEIMATDLKMAKKKYALIK